MKALIKIGALLALMSSFSAGVRAQDATPEQRKEVLSQVTDIVTKMAFVPGVDFSKWPEFLEAQKDRLESAKTNIEFASAINDALGKFGASHIVFTTPESVRQMREGKVVGLGIQPEQTPDGIKINDVFPGSAAAEAGLEPGDLIVEADGKKAESIPQLRGEEGTEIGLRVKKPSGLIVEKKVKRRAFSTKLPETLKWQNKEVAVLKVPSFMTYDRQNVEKLVSEAASAKLLVVDLRSNGGGQVLNLLHLCGLVFPKDTALGTFITKQNVNAFVKEKQGSPTDLQGIAEYTKTKVKSFTPRGTPFVGKVACLINGGSGSASEIFAAGVREVMGGPLIGTRSAGAVLASIMMPVKHGFQLQFPFQDYVTIKGLRLEGNGLKPDVEAATPRSPRDPDPGLEAVMKWAETNKIVSLSNSL